MNIIEAIGRVDYEYWVLNQLNEQIDHATPLERMIDAATGFDGTRVQTAIGAVKDIIKCKRILGYEVGHERKFLKALQSHLKAIQSKQDNNPFRQEEQIK